jgi:hypothetical protein
MSQDPLNDIQVQISRALLNDPFFSNIPVITELKGDILNTIEIKLGKIGLCVIVETVTGKPETLGVGAYSLDLKVAITVTENVVVNQSASGTKKSASQVVAMILCLLNPARQVPAFAESFVLVNDSGGALIYLINCKATAGFKLE